MGQCFSIALHVLGDHITETQTENDQHQKQQQQQPPKQNQQQQNSHHNNLSPIYPSLPLDAKQYKVRNVYDGDTLTLTDERRVRLLGIDTPEIKEQQPFAQEAKAYTKDNCDKKDIWISFEPNQKNEDHYGRLLAFVWVQTSNGYLCINEGIVAAGYATAYIPNQESKLHNWDKFIALQSNARQQKRGMWKTFHDDTVFKTANGSAFHQKNCKHLEQIKNLTELKRSDAMERGLHPCRTCLS